MIKSQNFDILENYLLKFDNVILRNELRNGKLSTIWDVKYNKNFVINFVKRLLGVIMPTLKPAMVAEIVSSLFFNESCLLTMVSLVEGSNPSSVFMCFHVLGGWSKSNDYGW